LNRSVCEPGNLFDCGFSIDLVFPGAERRPELAQPLRTPPLWGLRARNRLMHDGATVSRTDAINRHSGEAYDVVTNFLWLSSSQQTDLINFLNTL
jgi:CxxC motif-containing protein (DUF1111 family)